MILNIQIDTENMEDLVSLERLVESLIKDLKLKQKLKELSKDFETKQVNEVKPQEKQPEQSSITIEAVNKKVIEKAQEGYFSDTKALLGKYKASHVTALKPSDYEAFYKDLDQLGANQ